MNPDERVLTKLSRNLDTVRRWFEEARRFTHAPARGPNWDTEPKEPQGSEDSGEDKKVKICGPLDIHFRGKGSESQNERPSKRDRDDISHTEGVEAKKARDSPRGPRGPYTKQSPMTLWRKKVHVEKHASDIQQIFKRPARSAECIVVGDEPDMEDMTSQRGGRAGSFEPSVNGNA